MRHSCTQEHAHSYLIQSLLQGVFILLERARGLSDVSLVRLDLSESSLQRGNSFLQSLAITSNFL